MKGPVLIFFLLWIFWVLLTGFGYQEIIVGGMISFVIAFAVRGFFRGEKARYAKGFLFFLAYIPYYVYCEILAVSEVIYRIITGKINPGIVEIPHSHKHEWGVTVLSNSITMTPGTLTLEAEPDRLFVHWLHVKGDKNKITERFEKILKKIWD
jgi:multicomponent Na+:H+ antiporter subunit E